MLGQVNRSFTCFTKDIMLQIFKVFVRPHLQYAVTTWNPWLRKDIEALERIQHRATRRMSDVRGSYPERLRQLNLTTLEERRIRGDAIEVYKSLHGSLDVPKDSLFKICNQTQQKTRHQHSYLPLEVPRARLDLRKNFFTIRGANVWNGLPSHVRKSNSVNVFKNAYDRCMNCK